MLASLNMSHGLHIAAGNLSVGGATAGARSMLLESMDASAELNVTASAAGAASSLNVITAKGGNASLYLGEQNGGGFTLSNRGTSNKFAVSSGKIEVMTIAATTGKTEVKGNTNVGG